MSTVVTRRPIYGRQGSESKTGYWLEASIDGAQPIGFARLFLRARTTGPNVPHPELAALAAKIDAAVLPQPEPERLLTDDQRERLIQKCAERIADALRQSYDLALEAALEGRIGLREMEDGDLIDYAWDCWEIELAEFAHNAEPQPA